MLADDGTTGDERSAMVPARACKVLALVVLFVTSLSGCATLLKGSGDPLRITSTPTAATVTLNGVEIGTTPIQMRVPAKDLQLLRFSKDGYRSSTVAVSGSVGSGWVILDILCGLVPVIVDAATGSWYTRDREIVHVTMQNAGGSIADTAAASGEVGPPSDVRTVVIDAGKKVSVMGGKVTIGFGANSVWEPSLGFTGIASCSKPSDKQGDVLVVKIRRGDQFTVRTVDGEPMIVRVVQERGKMVGLELSY